MWWGIFDNELYVEHGEERYGPYRPIDGPIPLHRYRSFKKTKQQKRADSIDALAEKIALPRTALDHNVPKILFDDRLVLQKESFTDPDPFQEFTFPDRVVAKRAIADELGIPLAKLASEKLDYIDDLLAETLTKSAVLERVRAFFKPSENENQNVK